MARHGYSLIGLLVGPLLLFGCSDDDPSPSPTASITATAIASASPVASAPPTLDPSACPASATICDFSLALADASSRADFASLRSMMQLETFTCPGPTAGGLGGPYPLCEGASPGEERIGMRIAHLNSHGTTVPEPLAEIRATILNGGQSGRDVFTGPMPRIIGLHCPFDGASPDCSQQFVLFLGGATHLVIEETDSGYKVISVQFGHFAQHPSVFDTGGDFAMGASSRVRDGRFLPWRPNQSARDASEVRRDWLMAPSDISGVVLEPSEGACPATITLRVPEAALVTGPKGPEIVDVLIFDGPVSISDPDRSRPRELVPATPTATAHEFEITLDAAMLGGTLCSHTRLGLIVRGSTGPHVAGYRIIN